MIELIFSAAPVFVDYRVADIAWLCNGTQTIAGP
jgi:hypothetical protein